MAELSQIFNGMENGPKAIDNNFSVVSSELEKKQEVLGDTGWIKLSVQNAVGEVYARKIGKTVFISGSVYFTIATTTTNQATFLIIPNTMRPANSNSKYQFLSAFSATTEARDRFKITNVADAINVMMSANTKDTYQFDWNWQID